MICVPFEPHHVETLVLQPWQESSYAAMTPELLEDLALGPSYSLINNGVTLGCGGILHKWGSVALCWTWISEMGPKNFIRFHREAVECVETALEHYDRLELYVKAGFTEGHRWAKILGFQLEVPNMKKALQDGSDAALFVRIAGER